METRSVSSSSTYVFRDGFTRVLYICVDRENRSYENCLALFLLLFLAWGFFLGIALPIIITTDREFHTLPFSLL